jgi:hypothetical protein
VGVRTAEAFVAYVDDPRRFGRCGKVGSYVGLVPCQDASADKNRLGHVTREGPPTVRKLLCEASWQGVRRSPTIKAWFERIGGGGVPGQTREQHERQDEKPGRDVGEQRRLQAGVACRLVGREDNEHVLVDIVVERAEGLGAEERQEASLGQQLELRLV